MSTMDPLHLLGDSLFVHVLTFLPLGPLLRCERVTRSWQSIIRRSTNTLLRPLAHTCGIKQGALNEYEALFNNQVRTSWLDGDSADTVSEPELEDKLDWRTIIQKHTVLQNNWRKARARPGWVAPTGNDPWRLKVCHEENTMIMTTRSGNILVWALERNLPLFEWTSDAPFSHLEYANGFVIFNIGPGNALEVHLTPPAYGRLSATQRRAMPLPDRSHTHNTGRTYVHADSRVSERWVPQLAGDGRPARPPRGHLTYYRTIHPSTECFAFRARVDEQGTEGEERVVLATAGAKFAYVYDLADGTCIERYQLAAEGDPGEQPSYIELDDDYLFVCGDVRLDMYSRTSKQKLVSFSPETCRTNWQQVDLAFDLSLPASSWPQLSAHCGLVPLFRRDLMEGGSICHYTTRDLFATTTAGLLYVLRDYASVLSIADSSARSTAVQANTLVICGDRFVQLTTEGEHVVFTSEDEVFFLDTSTLPPAPFITSKVDQPIVVYSFANVIDDGMLDTSALQVDERRIYLEYWARAETNFGDMPWSDGEMPPTPAQATAGMGRSVKVWDFSEVDGNDLYAFERG
ncbi:hypothetical protein IAU60_000734 [Kwoniella sp. DSM 27419]